MISILLKPGIHCRVKRKKELAKSFLVAGAEMQPQIIIKDHLRRRNTCRRMKRFSLDKDRSRLHLRASAAA
jgi:hypothetical protein